MRNDRRRELKIESGDRFKIRFGTMDKHCPSVIYIKSATKVKPNVSKTNYKKEITAMQNTFLSFVDKTVKESKLFLDEYICHFDTNKEGMTYGKNSYMKYELYVRPKALKFIDDYTEEVKTLAAALNAKIDALIKEKEFVYV